MSLFAASLVILSAVLHVAWNIMGKHHALNLFFVPMATLAGASLLFPFVFVASPSLFSAEILLLLVATTLFQALYIASLSICYSHADISVSYPLIRGLPILSVALISTLLIPAASLPLVGWLGVIAMIIASCLMTQQQGERSPRLSRSALLYISLAVLGTTGYSLVDSEVMSTITRGFKQENWQQWVINSLAYASLQGLGALIWLLAFYLIRSKRWPAHIARQQNINQTLIGGVIMLGSYALILCSMPLVDNVSYVVALRQISIPLSIFAGSLLLGESQNLYRWLAGLTMLCGIFMLSFSS